MLETIKTLYRQLSTYTDNLQQRAVLEKLERLIANRGMEAHYAYLPTHTPQGWVWFKTINRRIKYIKVYRITDKKTNDLYIIWFDIPPICTKEHISLHSSDAIDVLTTTKLLIDPRVIWEYL
jgi:hypothetical protein